MAVDRGFTGTIGNVSEGVQNIYANDKVEVLAWGLDITNRAFYPVRKMISETGSSADDYIDWLLYPVYGNNNNNRFRGNVVLPNTATVRTYWAQDPNYSEYTTFAAAEEDVAGTALEGMFNLLNRDDELTDYASNASLYCLENTFDVNNQNQNQTTRVIIKANYTPKNFADGQDFYSIGGNRGFYYLDDAAAKTGYEGWNEGETYEANSAENTVVNVILGTFINRLGEDLHVFNADQVAVSFTGKAGANTVSDENTTISYTVYSHTTGEGDNEKTTYMTKSQYEEETQGMTNLAEQGYAATTNTTLSEKDWATLAEAIGTINKYQAGLTYYTTYIRHFSDDEVPALDATGNGKIEYDNDYVGDGASYLGRYGVLRNNWYQITVNSISGPGSADIPERTPDPDDEVHYYLSVDVNVLSWAVRQQSVDL
ncbi:MAG: Mfa1 fimbrilin C-terminal domain-containing protein [Bacteroidaceae bacterium]